MRWFSAILICCMCAAQGQTPSRQAARIARTVTVLPLGTNGESLKGCRVEIFLDLDSKDERHDLFDGLFAEHVPFGRYSIYTKCGPSNGASSTVIVNREDTFLIVSSARHVADYMPGHAPTFRVSVSNSGDFPSPVWVQLIGVFRDDRVVDRVRADAKEALLLIEDPGSYILTVFSRGRALCRELLRIDDPGGSLTIQIGKQCVLHSSRGITLQESAPVIQP